MRNLVTRALNDWCEARRKELHPRIRRLIALAKWHLHHGPDMEGQDDEEDAPDGSKVVWPGWESALNEISDAIEPLVQDVYVNIETEEVQTQEPEPDTYEDANPDPDGPEFVTITNDVNWEDWYEADAQQVKAALIGEDLAQYAS